MAELNALGAAPAVFLPLDASDLASIQALVAAVADKYDKQIDLLVRAWGAGLGMGVGGVQGGGPAGGGGQQGSVANEAGDVAEGASQSSARWCDRSTCTAGQLLRQSLLTPAVVVWGV